MKKVLVDIYHLPQLNFFKNTILAFSPDEVDIYCVNRGKLFQVIKHELPGYNVIRIGDYKYNHGMYSMILKIIIPRFYSLFRKIKPSIYNFILTANYQANFIGKLKGIPNIAFNDDPRRFVFQFLKFSADEVYLPPFGSNYKGVKFFNALKEWSYLSPKYFSPDRSALNIYNVDQKKYIFIREVSTETSNYLAQRNGIMLSLADKFPSTWKVVLSVENKASVSFYPKNWIILKEPVSDIHSIMYYSSVVISSGDSMAREGAMLGVPSVYAGIRDMPANQIMIKKRMLFKLNAEAIISTVSKIIDGEMVLEEQDKFRERLFQEWEDVTQLILNKSGKYFKK